MRTPATPSVRAQRRAFVLAACMGGASLAAWALTPTRYWSDHVAKVKYATLFPPAFGDWVLAPEQLTMVINPQQQQTLDAIYDEIVNKVYIDRASGRRMMVSLAYGNNQSRATQVHKPEVCYPAQGFAIVNMAKVELDVGAGVPLPVMRVVTQMGRRHEPLTYWIRAGDRVVRGAVEQNLARVSLGLRGYIPDGMLFRVSEINPDTTASFALQDRFLREFLAQLPPAARESLVGSHAAPGG